MMQTGVVFNIMRYAIGDGPGIRTTIFFKGCPLACLWCHNPESQSPVKELIIRRDRCLSCGACLACCPVACQADCRLCGRCAELCPAAARELIGREYSVSEVMIEIEKDRIFYEESGGGVTFSGGEPLAQRDFLLALLQASRQQGLHTAVDTCGYGPYANIAKAAPFTDLFLYDLKIMDCAAHLRYTGAANVDILNNLRLLASDHPNVQLRVPIIPGITAGMANLQAMATFLQPLPIRQIELLPYHNTALGKYRLLGRDCPEGLRQPSQQLMIKAANTLATSGHSVLIGGVANE